MKEKLLQLEKLVNKFDKTILDPATDKQITQFLDWISNWNIDASEYVELLRIANGFNFDGLFVYSIMENDANGIYQSNEVWHEVEENQKYLFFADADISWYCFDLEKHVYCELDKPSGTLLGQYANFSEMIKSALDVILDRDYG